MESLLSCVYMCVCVWFTTRLKEVMHFLCKANSVKMATLVHIHVMMYTLSNYCRVDSISFFAT